MSIVAIFCYVFGELYKLIFRKKQEYYSFIPIFTTIFGGILSIFIYFTNPELLMNIDNVWKALEFGFVSGASSTGTNQIIKQLLKKENLENE